MDFQTFANAVHEKAVARARRMVGERDADDCAQNALVAAWRAGRTDARWFFACLRNQCVSILRKRRSFGGVLSLDACVWSSGGDSAHPLTVGETVADREADNPADAVCETPPLIVSEALLAWLPPTDAQILRAVYCGRGRRPSLARVARRLGYTNANSLGAALSRARARARRWPGARSLSL